jgi:hypothetical protein
VRLTITASSTSNPTRTPPMTRSVETMYRTYAGRTDPCQGAK